MVIFTFGILLSPAFASAAVNYTYGPGNVIVDQFAYTSPPNTSNYTLYNTQYGYPYNQAPNQYYYNQAPTPVNYTYYHPAAPVYMTIPADSTPATSYTSTTKEKTAAEKAAEDSAKSLAANAVYGSSGFLPSGIIQWIFVAVLILFIVILARIVFGNAKRYHEEPLKHE